MAAELGPPWTSTGNPILFSGFISWQTRLASSVEDSPLMLGQFQAADNPSQMDPDGLAVSRFQAQWSRRSSHCPLFFL